MLSLVACSLDHLLDTCRWVELCIWRLAICVLLLALLVLHGVDIVRYRIIRVLVPVFNSSRGTYPKERRIGDWNHRAFVDVLQTVTKPLLARLS